MYFLIQLTPTGLPRGTTHHEMSPVIYVALLFRKLYIRSLADMENLTCDCLT